MSGYIDEGREVCKYSGDKDKKSKCVCPEAGEGTLMWSWSERGNTSVCLGVREVTLVCGLE